MDKKVVLVSDRINEIAREMYRLAGYTVREDYNFFSATHPQEVRALEQAIAAWTMITGDSPDFNADFED